MRLVVGSTTQHRRSATRWPAWSRPKRLRVHVAALGTSLLIHALMISVMVFGGISDPSRAPNVEGVDVSGTETASEGAITVMLITPPARIVSVDARPDDPEKHTFARDTVLVRPRSPKQSPQSIPVTLTDLNAPSLPSETTGGTVGEAAMFGRYMGQISARIERAWVRPRTPLAEPIFECRVHIAQGARGEVMELMMEDCSGELRWQASLAAAIATASPLPAPPEPSVYTPAVTLTFRSEPFRPGGSDEGFEPENRPAPLAISLAATSFAESEPRAFGSGRPGRVVETDPSPEQP